MSGLYQYFLTTVLFVAIATFSALVFYPRSLSDASIAVQSAINRTYISTLLSTKHASVCCDDNCCIFLLQYTIRSTMHYGFSVSHTTQYDVLNLTVTLIFSNELNFVVYRSILLVV